MPDWWEQDKVSDPNQWWQGDSPSGVSTATVLEDPNEAYKKGVEVQDMAVELESPLETIEVNYKNLTEKPKKIIPGTIPPSGVGEPDVLRAAPERTKWQKFKKFFVGERPPLPPNADRIEKLTRAFDIGISGPMRTFLKFGKGMTFNAPDLMWAAIKRITPEDMWVDEVRNMNLDEAMDWAGGYNPSGFQKSVGEIAEFVGRVKTVAPIAQKLGVIGDTPKSITVLNKAFETAKLFGTAAVVEQVTKGASEIIEPTEAEYGFEGPKAVFRDMALGAIFSLVSSGVKGLWSKLTPSEYQRALKLLGLKKGATQEQITKAANSLARQYHPDKAKGFIEDFKQVIKARDLLRQGEVKDIVYRGQKVVLKPKILPSEPTPTGGELAPQPTPTGRKVEIPTVTPAAEAIAKPEGVGVAPEGKVVFHGGKTKVTKFDAQKIGTGSKRADWGYGFYFGTERTTAEKFGKAVTEATLDYKNPYKIEALDPKQTQRFYDEFGVESGTFKQWVQSQTQEQYFKEMKSREYDAVEVYDKGKLVEIVVFDAEQIKLAQPVAKAEPKLADMSLDELKKESAVFDKKIETEIARLDKIAPERQRFAEAGIDHLSQEDVARYTEINYEIARRTGISQAEAKKRVLAKRAARKAKEAEPAKVVPAPLRKPVTVSGKEYHPQTVPVESIGVDPKKFQFKLGAKLAGGVTEALKAVEKYDPVKAGTVLLWQDKEGKYWVIDGHHRVALARKTGQETMDAWVVREADGWSAADARATGALRNLADGKGTAVDAAKLFRDSNITLEQLRKEGVPTNNTIVQQGMEMKNLSDEVFRLVIDERLPANMASAIGREVKGPTQQKQVADLILEGEIETVRQAEFLGMTIDTAPVLTKQEQTLFGLETTEKSLYAERAKILANVEKKLKTNKKVFGTLAKQSGLIESKGNILDRIANMETKEMAEEVLYMLDKFANAKGEVAEALNEATKEYAKYPTKDNLTKITNELVQKWTEATTGLTVQNIKGLFGAPAKGAEQAVGLVEFAEKQINDRGNFTLPGDTLKAELKNRTDEEIIELMNWSRGQSAHVKRNVESVASAVLRSRKIPVDTIEWQQKNLRITGKLDITPLQNAFDMFMNVIEPSKAVEIKLGKEVYATVIKGVHKADVARIEFNEEKIENMDRSLREFGEALAKYPKKVLQDLMLSRGKPHSPGAIELRDQALKDLVKEAPELVGTRKTITRIADFNYKYLTDVAGDKIHYVEDYFYGIYKDPGKVERFIQYWKTTKRFTKEKKLPTVADAVDYGLSLRDYNPVNNLMSEYMAIARLDGMIEMRDALMRTGEDKYISKDPEKIADPDKIPEPVFKGLWLDADLARMIKKLISTNKIQKIPILNGLRKLNNILRSIKFTFSMFHHLAEAKQSVADSGYFGFLHKKTAVSGVTFGFKKGDPIFQTKEYKDYIAHGGGHRYSIDSEAQRTFTRAINKLTKSSQLIVKGITAPLRIPETYIRWLFESYIPRVKYAKYLDTTNEKEKRLGRELTSPEIIDIIKEQQNFYGMMNERLFGRSGTMTTLLRFKFMAPGFAEGNFRTILKSILQWGQEGSFAAGRSRANIINSFLLTGIAATIGTLILTGKLPEKPKEAGDIRDMFKIDTGKDDLKGRRIMIDLMSYDKDYWTIFGKPLVGQAGEVPRDVFRRIGGMTATTWEVMSDMNKMSMGEAIYDWKGDRVTEVTDPFARRVLDLIIYETRKAEPISTNIFRQSRNRGFDRLTAAITTLLGARPTTSEKDKRESQIISRIFSLRDRQERLYYFLGTIKNPGEHIDKYNKIAQSILDNPVTTEEMREKWGENLIIDTERLVSNKVHAYELAKVTDKPKPDELEKLKKWLTNFGITKEQYRKQLTIYEMKHRKLILEMKATDADELLKNEIAKFYADKGILERKVKNETATDSEKRQSRKYSKISSNISEIGTLIHKTENATKRKRYYERVRALIERSE